MDVVSQAVFGASFSQSLAKDKSKQISAIIIGALAGMSPDLDVFIRSADDPLLFLEYHRQFTHSLFFIPFGALICTILFYPFIKHKLTFAVIYLFSFAGYATHGLLDACTSYGTQIFWPFSSQRVSWDIVSIIDPLFTIPVFALIIVGIYRSNKVFSRLAFIYAVVFLSAGFIQKQRAENALYALAAERGHQVERTLVKPGFGNRLIWKMIYESGGRYYVDAVKLLGKAELYPGTSIEKLDITRDFPWLQKGSQQARDIERFRRFSADFLAVNPEDPNIIFDIRNSFLPNQIKLMWGIKLQRSTSIGRNPEVHVKYIINNKINAQTRKQFFDMFF